ncbi:helix-turn-helix domain-containing protein [Natronomonas gomsonensis]|uniref:winged helix-turn-helix transcriptional regulator n=1 Tax=Natronomonas gomsonensis TaxID=1046043 RepID=UPI0015C0ED4F|nr:helix-turn-helix domain-containing protein [Natronomonas gomsonensis]
MELRLRTLVVCTLLVASVALSAVAPAAAAISDDDDDEWETDEREWGDNDSDWQRNDSEPVRNLTETATGTVENTTGTVLDNATNATNATNITNITNATAGTATDGTDGEESVDRLVALSGADTEQWRLDDGVAGLDGVTASPALAGAPTVDVTSGGVAVEVGSTTNSAPGLAVDVPLSGSTTSDSGSSVTPPADTDAADGPELAAPSTSAETDGDADAKTAAADGESIAVEPTTGGDTTGGESAEPSAEDDGEPPASLLGSLAWFDGAALLDYVPALGTAMFVAVAQPWTGFLSVGTALVADWLGRFGAMFRFGRHDGSDPLEHETRERIHDRITDSPGVSLSALADDLDTPLSTVRHHLRVLERERLVTSRKLRGNRRLFPIGTENEELAAALEKDSSAAIIDVLRTYGAATVGDIVDEVETSYSTVSYHLSRLADDGLVVQEKDGASKVTRLAPSVRSTLDNGEGGVSASGGREVSAD